MTTDDGLPPAAADLRALLHDHEDLDRWAQALDTAMVAALQVQVQQLHAALHELEQMLLAAADDALPVSLHLRCWTVAVQATLRLISAHLSGTRAVIDTTAIPAWLNRYRADPIAAARDGIDLVAGDLLAEQ